MCVGDEKYCFRLSFCHVLCLFCFAYAVLAVMIEGLGTISVEGDLVVVVICLISVQ